MRRLSRSARRTQRAADEAAQKPPGIWGRIGATALSKVGVMGLSGVLGLITTRMIISHFGSEAYAQYGLLSSLPALLPFADLGIGAVILNTIAGSDEVRRDERVRRTITTAIRILLVSGGIIAGLGFLIELAGLWPTLLGNGLMPGGGLTAAVCLAIYALALPLAVGQRIVVGLGKSHLQVASQAVVSPFMLGSVGALIALSVAAGPYLSVFSYIGNSLVSVICFVIAWRLVSPQLRHAWRDVLKVRRVPGVKVLDVAWPMVFQMTALPLAMQTDRLLLSHLTTGIELAQYNLASQLFGIVAQTVSTAGVALWPHYAKARASRRVESPAKPTAVFLVVGLALGLAMALVSPWVVDFVSDGAIELDRWLVGGFVVFVAVQAAKQPPGMYMTDARGLRFQMIPILVMVPLNVGVSWWLIGLVGAGGPIIGSAFAVLLCQLIPNLLFVRRDLRRRRVEALAGAPSP